MDTIYLNDIKMYKAVYEALKGYFNGEYSLDCEELTDEDVQFLVMSQYETDFINECILLEEELKKRKSYLKLINNLYIKNQIKNMEISYNND